MADNDKQSRAHVVPHIVTVSVLSIPVGAVSGLAAWALFESLDRATEWRVDRPWLVWLLPVAAFVLGAAYHYAGGAAGRGTPLVIGQLSPTTDPAAGPAVPYRMAPMIFGATFIAQLTGASVGREGAALQIGGSLVSLLTRPLRLDPNARRTLLLAAVAGSFGGAFGVPLAGAVFGLEVRRTRHGARRTVNPPVVLAAVVSSFVADRVVEGLGRRTDVVDMVAELGVRIDWWVLVRLVAVGVSAGLAARLFTFTLHSVKHAAHTSIAWAPLRPVVGGAATLGLMILFGRDYLGLSLPLVDQALTGPHSDWWDPVLKIVFTALALGCSIPGGEVTPLFVVGGTMGSFIAGPLDLDPRFTAAATLAAVFGAAARTPLACTILVVELFDIGMFLPAAAVCLTAAVAASRRGIYDDPTVGVTSTP